MAISVHPGIFFFPCNSPFQTFYKLCRAGRFPASHWFCQSQRVFICQGSNNPRFGGGRGCLVFQEMRKTGREKGNNGKGGKKISPGAPGEGKLCFDPSCLPFPCISGGLEHFPCKVTPVTPMMSIVCGWEGEKIGKNERLGFPPGAAAPSLLCPVSNLLWGLPPLLFSLPFSTICSSQLICATPRSKSFCRGASRALQMYPETFQSLPVSLFLSCHLKLSHPTENSH